MFYKLLYLYIKKLINNNIMETPLIYQHVNHNHDINTWSQLKQTLRRDLGEDKGTDIINGIKRQGLEGDPDWLWDILTEVGNISPDSPFYIPEFHGTLQKYTINTEYVFQTYIHFYIKPNTK